MINTLFAVKKQMTSAYDARGRRVGATILEVGPNFVTQVKTSEGNDGYNAVQLGFKSKKSVNKPQMGHYKKAGLEQSMRWTREVRTEETDLQPGQEIKLNQVFSIGDAVKVTGLSKGKGFQGGVKRYNFAGGPKTHGQSDRHRAPGSIGAGTTPGRVLKGKRMAGHMGSDTVSKLNLEVVAIDRVNNFITLKGPVPGPVGSLIRIEKLGRIKGYTPPPEEKEDEEEEGAEKKVEAVETPVENQEAAPSDTPEIVVQPETQPSDQQVAEEPANAVDDKPEGEESNA